MSKMLQEYDDRLDGFLEDILVGKLPKLPKGGKDFLVMVMPWLALVGGVLGVFAVLSMLGLGMMATPALYYAAGRGLGLFWLSGLIMAVVVVLNLMAFQPLKNKKYKGWKYIYYASILGFLSALIAFQMGGLLMNFVSLYLLYQVKNQYVKENI